MPDLEKQADTVAQLLREMSVEVSSAATYDKIDWMKLLELIMKILPLILSFFKPENGQPQT